MEGCFGPNCYGECGATVERTLSIDPRLLLDIFVDPSEPFISENHRPLFAGRNLRGENVHIAWLCSRRCITITDAIKKEDIVIREHYLDGSTKEVKGSDCSYLQVPVLRYEPCAGLPDGTGPSDWKFSHHLPTPDCWQRKVSPPKYINYVLWIERIDQRYKAYQPVMLENLAARSGSMK